jgi:hypothetical protein
MPDAQVTTRARAAADKAPSGPDALYAAAVALWRERRRDEAIQLMDEALHLKPDFADALCMGGYMLSECASKLIIISIYCIEHPHMTHNLDHKRD